MEALGTKNMFAVAGAGSRMRLTGKKAEMAKLKALAMDYGKTFNIHFDSILFEI
jgi:hypothetical protein